MTKYFNSLKTILILFNFLFVPIYSIIDSKTLNNILLQEQNKYRKIHNSKKLTLDSKIVNDATVYAQSLAQNSDPYYLEPSNSYYNSDEKYGENLFQCNKKSCKLENITLVTDIWYNESNSYDFKLNKGLKGTYNFTQMIWRNTKKIGCGIGYRSDESYKVVCFYYPRGNINGKYEENVLIGNNTITEEEIKTDQPQQQEYNNYEDYITEDRSFFVNKINLVKIILCALFVLI